MDLFSELQTAVQSDLTIDSTSSLFNTTTIKLAINRSYIKASTLFRWPDLDDAKKTSAVASQEYYDYPSTWRPQSAYKLTVDDVDYGDPLAFGDYNYERENGTPSGLTKFWATHGRQIFIYPTPTANGSLNIKIWGQKNITALSGESDITIFSYSMPECNEAIVLEAVAILRAKGEDLNTTAFKSSEAKLLLSNAWNKILEDKKKYEKTRPFFDVPDYYKNTIDEIKNNIGDF
jgi:hypothetical protein